MITRQSEVPCGTGQSDTENAQYQAMFADPLKKIFSKNQHVGTIYIWNDGSEMTVWFDEKAPVSDCTVQSFEGQAEGWRSFFLNSK
ncbi:hypothetical protein [Parasulfitobacter algicola]|uniref:Uncharacterized protein n=1 Tax=Parasulfitobacter algicola TaxID=2614809 RepID=A0ABX2IV45_9RHOB|nr:hypothetical protein [Sulfitobacter algicola]NSX56789.1 hypothetical protein [Sulfitobacter algicola]